MALEHWKIWVKVAWIPLSLLASSAADFTSECQRPCDCRWQSGNKAAGCAGAGLRAVPANLSADIQILDLAANDLRVLPHEAFRKVGLTNLKKLFLRDCNIETVHRAAFATLAIMIELDLSKNKITSLHPDTFHGTEKLRLINLSNNLIEKLEDGLFRNMKFLQKVEVSNNRIVRIGTKTFINLPQLKILRFDGNMLTHMKPETLMALRNLSGLDLHNNPWRCDCNLQTFRDWVISHNLYTPPTACADPATVRDKLWNELDSTNFACRPTILAPAGATVSSSDENVTLTCKVVGNPTPDVVWRYNGRTIETRAFGEIRYVITENTIDLIRWVNLTILNVRYSDRGNYTCVAENPGGRDENSLILVLSRYSGSFIAGMDADSFAVLVGCLLAIALISGAVLAVCYLTSQNGDRKRLIKAESANAEAVLETSTAEEKALKVNPVTKPPRKHEPAASLASEATEMSELNRTLLDSDSVRASTEDNSHPLEVELPKLSQEALLVDRLTQDQQAYPPDLLSFPLRGGTQVSPASASERAQLQIGSPIKSPGYAVTTISPALYNRLQTANFHNPLPISPKSGYVTLPRRPRANQSDSRQPFSTLNGVIPYEFNMRLFSNGASYCSLNKSEMDLGPVNELSRNFESDEVGPAPSPAPGTPHAPGTPRAAAPRSSLSSPNIHSQLLTLQAMSMNAAQGRLQRASEQRPLKVTLADNEGLLRHSRDRSGYSVNVVSGRTRAVPQPPPKTWKKNASELKEPFLNAVENATQV